MSRWTECQLGDVVTLHRGYDLPERQRVPGSVPIISSSGVTGYHDVAKVRGPGVVTGRYGTLGNVFFSQDDYWPLNTALYVSDFKGNDPRFISYLLQTLDLGRHNSAGAVPGINRSALHLLPVRVPDILARRQIASILGAYDDLIENNARRITILDAMARSIYREWFEEFRFPGHERVRMVPSAQGMIPEGWETATISSFAELSRDAVSPEIHSDEMFDHFSIPAYDGRRMPTREAGTAIKSNKFVVPFDSVLLSKINPHIPRVWLPLLEHGYRAIASTEFLVLRPGQKMTRAFLFSLCQSQIFSGRFAGSAIGTSTSHQRVKPEHVMSMQLIVPPMPLLRGHERVAMPILDATLQHRCRTANLNRTRDLLLIGLISRSKTAA